MNTPPTVMNQRCVCPACGQELPPRATICLACNINAQTGQALDFTLRRPRKSFPWGAATFFCLVVGMSVWGYIRRDDWLEPLTRWMEQRRQVADSESSPPPPPTKEKASGSDSRTRLLDQLMEPEQARLARIEEWLDPEPESPGESPLASPNDPRTPSPPTRTPSRRDGCITVPCPLCEGQGRLALPNRQLTSYACPVCFGKKSRDRRLAPGQKVCAACGGMGHIGRMDDTFRTRNRYVADRCTACRGSGVVKE